MEPYKSITHFAELMLSSTDRVPCVSMQFLVTPLNAASDAILGLNWLTETNLKINWATCSVAWTPITDYKTVLLHPILTSEPLEDLPVMEDDDVNHPDPLKFIPPEYHDFADIFSKTPALQLSPSHPFDHTIDLKDNAMLGHGSIYSLSEPEHTALKEFIDDHLATGTIHLSQSPIGAPVLFVKKKDGTLHTQCGWSAISCLFFGWIVVDS